MRRPSSVRRIAESAVRLRTHCRAGRLARVTIRVPKALLVTLVVLAIPAAGIGGYFYGRSTRDVEAAARDGYVRGHAEGKREQKQACRPLLRPEVASYEQGYRDGKADLPRREPMKIGTFGDC